MNYFTPQEALQVWSNHLSSAPIIICQIIPGFTSLLEMNQLFKWRGGSIILLSKSYCYHSTYAKFAMCQGLLVSCPGKRKKGMCMCVPVCTSDQIRSVAQSCPTLCDPMNRSTPGLPVHHQLPEFTQTHVHRVRDAIQPSHPLSSPSPLAPNPSQHQSFPMSQLFAWGGQSTGVSALASFLPKKSQNIGTYKLSYTCNSIWISVNLM